MNPKRLIWMACDCHCWPIALGHGAGRCKECRQVADRPCETPADGKAYRLDE